MDIDKLLDEAPTAAMVPVEVVSSCDDQLIDHKRLVGSKMTYFCTKCLSSFMSRWNLRVHQDTVHEKVRPHACRDCDKMFGTTSGLKRHVRFVHQKLRPYRCVDCGEQFASRSILKKHAKRRH